MKPLIHRSLCLFVTLSCAAGCGNPVDPEVPEAQTVVDDSAPEPPPQQPEQFVPGLPIEADVFSIEEGFERLSLADFAPFQGDENSWQEIDGVLVGSGEPKGYLFSNAPYGNYTWRAEYRYMPKDAEASPPPNTGFMIHIQEPHKTWPRSLEVQGRFDEMCSIKSNGGVPALTIEDDAAARESARKPVGEWNAVEIVSKDGALTATLNGQLICRSEPGELVEGPIGLQAELFEVHFRRLRIRQDN